MDDHNADGGLEHSSSSELDGYSSASEGDDDIMRASLAVIQAAELHLRQAQESFTAATLKVLQLLDGEVSDGEGEHRQSKIPRRVYIRPDYDASAWGVMLKDPALQDKDTKQYRSFRRRFRLPYPVFQLLVGLVEERGWFPKRTKDIAGRNCVPLELKVDVWLLLHKSVIIDTAVRTSSSDLFLQQ